eukprot:c25011_g1_i2 orf=374-670(+)
MDLILLEQQVHGILRRVGAKKDELILEQLEDIKEEIIVEDGKDGDQVAHVYATIKHQGMDQQFLFLQTPTQYEGTKFTMLIDFGSTHSFISLKCIRNL